MCKVDTLTISHSFPKLIAQKKFKDIQKSKKVISEISENVPSYSDALAILTIHTKIILFEIGKFMKHFEKSKAYKIVFGTTQPAHLVTILAVATVTLLIYPHGETVSENPPSPLLTMLYLASFSIHFGAQIWMTFVSGLALYFSLPRHAFGEVQSVLFPKYFVLNALMSLTTLTLFLEHNNAKLHIPQIASQVFAMTFCFLIETIIRQYLSPPLLKLMAEKNDMEKATGVGTEVGEHNAGELVNCPHYMRTYKRFRKIHMTIAIGNIICMACTVYHLHYLSQKLSVV
ncbi:transmembrane protein 205 [Agrilus planipennis]|uniref:Transmembrane protein 205 n=1 Tax=Agrilus planipennis TaxID=224129 RepID=A0A1W4X9N8_AGRPL|nr:transmembrane protein 205 [Agrilus planipennis]